MRDNIKEKLQDLLYNFLYRRKKMTQPEKYKALEVFIEKNFTEKP